MRNIEYIEYNLGSLGIHQVDLDLSPNKTSTSTIWLTFCIATVMRFRRFRQWMYKDIGLYPFTNPHKQNHTDSYQDYVETHKRIVILCVIVNHFLRNSKQLLGWHCWQQSAIRNKASSYFLRIDVNRRCKLCRQYFQFF